MIGRVHSSLVIVVLAAALAACNGGTPATDAGPSDAGADAGPDAGADGGVHAGADAGPDAGEPAFEVGLREAAQASPLYSIAFDDQGPFLLAVFPVVTGPFTCDTLETLPSPQWVLELVTPLASGTYAVGPSNSDQYPPLSGQAVVALRGSAPGSFQAIEILPSEGQVMIGTAPANPAAELSGGHLGGSFHVGFPADPTQPPQCFSGGEGLPDGGFINLGTACICEDVDGNTVSVCDGGSQDQCCLSTQPATIFVDGTFDAPPCYKLCVASPAAGGCQQLEPDGGGGPGECPAECSGPVWPNVLIGIEDADGGDASAAVAEVDVESFDGGGFQPAFVGSTTGVPSTLLVDFWAESGLPETPIAVHLIDGGEIDGTVAVGPDEICGANEGYALFSIAGTPRLASTQQIQLCR